ncbi:MAG TPA: hypothetical protein VFW87_17420 [Pirellulales bacterium]|nr:hypothetical protein [Pirellulales bacterium]
MPIEAVVLVLCSATALTLISGVAWLVNRRQTRGRHRGRAWSLATLRRWATSRQAAWSLGGLLLLILAGWWAADWLNQQSPPGEEAVELAQGIPGKGGAGEVAAFDAAIDPAARQKLLAERWQRGLPLLAVIGLVVAAWVALAHSGILDQQQRRKIAAGSAQDQS